MPSLVQFGIKENAVDPLQVTLTNTKKGNIIVVACGNQASAGVVFNTPTDGTNTYIPCANTALTSSSDTGEVIGMYYAINATGGSITTTASFTGTASLAGLYVFELNGCNAYDNGVATAATAPGTPINLVSSNPFTTSYGNEIIISLWASGSSQNAAGAGYTLIERTP